MGADASTLNKKKEKLSNHRETGLVTRKHNIRHEEEEEADEDDDDEEHKIVLIKKISPRYRESAIEKN
jgi:hypothetical protein